MLTFDRPSASSTSTPSCLNLSSCEAIECHRGSVSHSKHHAVCHGRAHSCSGDGEFAANDELAPLARALERRVDLCPNAVPSVRELDSDDHLGHCDSIVMAVAVVRRIIPQQLRDAEDHGQRSRRISLLDPLDRRTLRAVDFALVSDGEKTSSMSIMERVRQSADQNTDRYRS